MKTFQTLSIGCLILFALVCHRSLAAEPAGSITPGKVTELEFAKVGEVSLTLDAYVPEGNGPFMTCILVHGGGFMRGDKQSYIKPLFEPLSRAGFAWFSINYRLAPDHRWPACADDVATAVRWVRTHAQDYKVDRNRIALIGESAGGHLVAWAGTTGKGDTAVAAVVPFYAPFDLEFQVRSRNALGPSMTALLGLTELNDEAWKVLRSASPTQQVHSGLPPFLLIHGDQDAQVPYDQSPRFQEKMKAAGNVCDLIKVAGGEHGMGKWQQLGSDYQPQMIAWLKDTLSRKRSLSKEERQAQVTAGLKSNDAEVRRIAMHSLAHSDIADAMLAETQAALNDTDPEVREWAATVLGPRGVLAQGAVPALVKQLQRDQIKQCRETAARALGRIGKATQNNQAAVSALEQAAATDADSVTRVVALGALALMNPDSPARMEAVCGFVTHDDALTRMKAAHSLGYLGERAKSAAPGIALALQKATDPHERGYLARALGQVGAREQLPILVAEMDKEKNETALSEMRGAARRLGWMPPQK